MRELKDYFCDYTQREELNKLGLKDEEHEVVCEYYVSKGIPFAGILRSQALDFFRDLGYTFNSCITANDNKFAYDCLNRFGDYLSESFDSPHQPESALISLLIELEKEARNGK